MDKSITFSHQGICSHCTRYDDLSKSRVSRKKEEFTSIVNKIKRAGKNKKYDCILGISGGVDSSYLAYVAKKNGLRPLAVHLDNGWNSDLAVKNINRILDKLDIDLYTHVLKWNEFRELQKSFLRSGTPDCEIPTDHAINALIWRQASKRGIKYILSGMNFRTESINVPEWSYGHSDWYYIKNIHKSFSDTKLTNYPYFTFFDLFYFNIVRNIRSVSLLNYMEFDKTEVIETLRRNFDWVPYPGKHYESTYTKFFQSYILTEKFGIDKRYGHFSDLINSGQLKREDALEMLKTQPYDEIDIFVDRKYVLKKLGMSDGEFSKLMCDTNKSFRDYKNSYEKVQKLRYIVNKLRKFNIYPK